MGLLDTILADPGFAAMWPSERLAPRRIAHHEIIYHDTARVRSPERIEAGGTFAVSIRLKRDAAWFLLEHDAELGWKTLSFAFFSKKALFRSITGHPSPSVGTKTGYLEKIQSIKDEMRLLGQ